MAFNYRVIKNSITLLISIATFMLCLTLKIEANIDKEPNNKKKLVSINNSYEEDEENFDESEIDSDQDEKAEKIIKKIIISGNTLIPDDALYAKIPYKVGQPFDPVLTATTINNLYNLNYFDYIEIATEDINSAEINVHIIVKEKKKLESVVLEGNNNLTFDEIEKKFKISEIPTINKEEAEALAEQIKKLYQEKNFHDVKIETVIEPTTKNNVKLIFKINEGKKALVKQVRFVGNKTFPGKKLRSMIFTREDWILGAMDKSGTYQPEAIEYDKRVIEDFYQSNGFLAARVKDIKIDVEPETQCITVTFYIDEGDLYVIKSVSATSNHLLSEQQILAGIPIRPGQLYNKELIRNTLELLRNTWGQFGYIYADVNPIIQPDFENKTVDISFDTDLSNQISLNRINIIGNFKTRDYVIRRNILLNEGDLITTQLMEFSKSKIESLGFFEPKDGVNWKINKISENLADLDLYVKEIRTGRLYGQVGYGGADLRSPTTSLRVVGGISDRNFIGTGIRYNLNLTFSKEDRSVLFNIFQPWTFGCPIGTGLDLYVRRAIYDEFKNVRDIPVENVSGAVGQISFAPVRYPDLATICNTGFERIKYDNPIKVSTAGKTQRESELFQMLVDRRFQEGDLAWVGFITGQDLRNHPVFPSRGYNWNFSGKFGFGLNNSCFGYSKIDIDATWITPLIGDSELIFVLHGHLGFSRPFGLRTVPYRELYHIGGPATVRGFLFGQIGPQLFGDSIGAQKAFWLNAELIWTVTKDRSIRGVLFYDGGAGWDTPNAATFRDLPLRNNKFNFRHSVGFGIRLTQPTPLRIDWGFKLDRNKRLGEPISEVHFSMSQEF